MEGDQNPSECGEYTLDEVAQSMGVGRAQLLMCLFAGLAFVADSTEIMLLSFIGPEVRCEWAISSTQVTTGVVDDTKYWCQTYLAPSMLLLFSAISALTWATGV